MILGGGGHASVLIDILQSRGTDSLAILDRDPGRWGKRILGVPILGNDDLLPTLIQRGTRLFVVGVGGVRNNRPRLNLYELAVRYGLTPLSVRHPTAIYARSAKIGPGSALLAGSLVNANSVLGVNVVVNTGAIVEHDCVIGDHAHVATGARLCGAVKVGDEAHIGAGATILQGVTIGAGAVVGAGSVVIHDVMSWVTVVGVPAKVLGIPARSI